MATITEELAERALLLAQDPLPDDYAAAAELRRVAEDAGADEPGELLLAAMTTARAEVGDLTGERLTWAGRALLLLGLAIDAR